MGMLLPESPSGAGISVHLRRIVHVRRSYPISSLYGFRAFQLILHKITQTVIISLFQNPHFLPFEAEIETTIFRFMKNMFYLQYSFWKEMAL